MPYARDGGTSAPQRAQGSQPSTVRLLVVDDHRTIADLLAVALRHETDIEFVGHAATARQGIELAAALRPDVVLMDFALPDLDGLQATAAIVAEQPDTRVILLTASSEPRLIAHAAAVGACAFVPKSAGLDVLLDAVRGARQGAMVVDPGLLGALADLAEGTLRRSEESATASVSLTTREREVLGMLAAGIDVGGVSRRLGISQHTCRGYVKSVLAKLGCHSQLQAVVVATRLGLLDLPPDQQPVARAVGWGA
jgi:DNA-binding NarL/FixJ family response regulator